MNGLRGQGDETKNNGSLKSSKCRHCGLPQSKSSKKSTADSHEFGTIQLGDIFTDYVPQKSPSENNNEREGADDPCPRCALPGSSSPPLANHRSILINGMVKVEIPDLLGTLQPPGGTSVITTQVTPRINHYQSSPTNGVVSPLPVSVVLPNGLGIRSPNIPVTTSHVNGHQGPSNGLGLACTLCNKNFKNERLAISHQEKLHSKLARYTCPTCHGKFCYRGALNSHISSHHPQLASHPCSACGKTFKEKANLSAHFTIVHAQNPRLFKCEFCSSAFSKRVNLNYHRKRKHPEELAASGNTSNTLPPTMEHTHYHHHPPQSSGNNNNGSPHSYIPIQHPLVKAEPMDPPSEYEAGESSSVAAIIDTIASASHGEGGNQSGTSSEKAVGTTSTGSSRAEGDFKCQYCGRGFLFRNNLKCHLRTHIRDKKYTCEICEKSFIYKESLKNHMLLHSNELPYQCDICMKKFRDRSNRRKHVKNVHKFLLAANNGGGLGGNNGQGTTTSPSTSDPLSQQPKRRKRTAKKKSPPATSLPSSPPPPPKGVIVSPKSTEYGQPRGIVKVEVMSPEGQSQRSPEEYQGQGVHFKQEPEGHYHPPSMNHPNVIVYPKPKLEPQMQQQYHSTSSPPDPQVHPHPHSVISSSHSHHQYYEAYGQGAQGHLQHQQEGLPSYVSLMATPQSISPDRNTPYDSPGVMNMSMVHGQPGRGIRTDSSSPVTQHHHHHTVSLQEYSRSQGSLMYSSPIMGAEGGGEGYHHSYWIPPGTNDPLPRPYYSDPSGGLPTVTEGSLLNPQSVYVNTSPAAAPGPSDPQSVQVPPNHPHNYFYTDLAQFDLSHL